MVPSCRHPYVPAEQQRTPNFDVLCNRFIKFDAFIKHALETLGADLVATGEHRLA